MNVVMILIDGFGVPPEGWRNSVYAKYSDPEFINLFERYSTSIDATMGVAGIPQSATGQTAIFTGLKTAEKIGRHLPAFPGNTLKKWIGEQNLFSTLIKNGCQPAFANAYVRYTPEELERKRFASVTTVMLLSSLQTHLNAKDLCENNALYHDITRSTLQHLDLEKLAISEKPPLIKPELAANHLANFANKYKFTLFEYFLTDHAGHKKNFEKLSHSINTFTLFFKELIKLAKNNFSVILTSDHGNCENMLTSQHTKNPVPLFVFGELAEYDYKKINSINEIYHFLTTVKL